QSPSSMATRTRSETRCCGSSVRAIRSRRTLYIRSRSAKGRNGRPRFLRRRRKVQKAARRRLSSSRDRGIADEPKEKAPILWIGASSTPIGQRQSNRGANSKRRIQQFVAPAPRPPPPHLPLCFRQARPAGTHFPMQPVLVVVLGVRFGPELELQVIRAA